jgi:hypothetical protein
MLRLRDVSTRDPDDVTGRAPGQLLSGLAARITGMRERGEIQRAGVEVTV